MKEDNLIKSKSECPYCDINISLEKHNKELFQWHLNGHGEAIKQEKEEKQIEHCDEKDCPECNLKAYNKGRKEMLEEVLKEIEGIPKKKSAKEMPYGNIDAYVGFNTALNSLKEKLTNLTHKTKLRNGRNLLN